MPLSNRVKMGPLVVDGSGASQTEKSSPRNEVSNVGCIGPVTTTDGAANDTKATENAAEKTTWNKPTTGKAISPVPEHQDITTRKRETVMNGSNIPFVLAGVDCASSQKQGWGQNVLPENDLFGPGRIIHPSPGQSEAAPLCCPPSQARPRTTEGTANASWAPKGFQTDESLPGSSRNADSVVLNWRRSSTHAEAHQNDNGKEVTRSIQSHNHNSQGHSKSFGKKNEGWGDLSGTFKGRNVEGYCANMHSDKREYHPCECKVCNDRNRSVFLYVQEDKSTHRGFDFVNKVRQGMSNEFGLVEEVYHKGHSVPNMIVR